MEKLTAVEWLVEQLINENQLTLKGENFKLIEIAKQIKDKQSQRYAEFAIHCDRREMKILEFNDYIKL